MYQHEIEARIGNAYNVANAASEQQEGHDDYQRGMDHVLSILQAALPEIEEWARKANRERVESLIRSGQDVRGDAPGRGGAGGGGCEGGASDA